MTIVSYRYVHFDHVGN